MNIDKMNEFSVGMMFDWGDLYKAFIDGALEMKRNPECPFDVIKKSADAYCKLIQVRKYEESGIEGIPGPAPSPGTGAEETQATIA